MSDLKKYCSDWFKLFADESAKEIVNKKYSILSNSFYVTFVDNLKNELSARFLSTINSIIKEMQLGNDSLSYYLINMIDEKESNEEIIKLAKEMCEKGIYYFDDKYPLFRKEIERIASLYTRNIIEMVDRVVESKSYIEKNIFDNKEINQINSYKTAGDCHNELKSTTILETDCGNIVYHPRDSRIDKWFSGLANLYFKSIIYVPKIVCVNNEYCFNEFIVNTPSSTSEQAKKYYYNLGCLLSIINAFDSSDFHFENIMVKDGIYPVVVDIETILNGERNDFFNNNDFNIDLLHSVVSKVFLPYNSFNNFELSILYNNTDQNKSMPVINNEKQDVSLYTEDFYDGFSFMYKQIESIKLSILSTFDEIDDYHIRQIIRPTSIYYKIRNRLFSSPEYYKSNDARVKLANSFKSNLMISTDEKLSKIVESEFNSIVVGDIPYFYCLVKSKDLCMYDKVVVKNYLFTSPRDNTIKKINSLSDAEYEFERKIIEKTINYKSETTNIEPYLGKEDIEIDDNEILNNVDEIYGLLKDSFITTYNGNKGFFAQDRNDNFEVENIYLSDGLSGIILFLSAYMKYREIDKQLLDISLDKIFSSIDTLCDGEKDIIKYTNLGMIDGLGGILLALDATKEYNKKSTLYISKILNIINNLDLSHYNNVSYESGFLGLLSTLYKMDLTNNQEIINEIIKKCKDILLKFYSKENNRRNVDLALSIKLIKMNNSELIDDEVINELNNSILTLTNDNKIESMKIARFLDKTDEVFNIDSFWGDRLYLGNSMLVDHLLSKGNINEARYIASNMINRKNKNNHFILTKKNEVLKDKVSLFYGVLGIGYELMRILDNNIKQLY